MQLLANRLLGTVTDSLSLGLGIAAPQVGILKDMIVVQRLDKEDLPFEAYVNPKFLEYSEETQRNLEGCLSIPNRSAECERALWIELGYQKLDGSRHQERIADFTAVIFQHEVDHLNGILYLDHLAEHRGARP